jgi:hypothetical protein
MNKLTKIRSARALGRNEAVFRAEFLPLRRGTRRALVCVWRRDPATGRLACSWTEAAEEAESFLMRSSAEPPPAFSIAA